MKEQTRERTGYGSIRSKHSHIRTLDHSIRHSIIDIGSNSEIMHTFLFAIEANLKTMYESL